MKQVQRGNGSVPRVISASHFSTAVFPSENDWPKAALQVTERQETVVYSRSLRCKVNCEQEDSHLDFQLRELWKWVTTLKDLIEVTSQCLNVKHWQWQ